MVGNWARVFTVKSQWHDWFVKHKINLSWCQLTGVNSDKQQSLQSCCLLTELIAPPILPLVRTVWNIVQWLCDTLRDLSTPWNLFPFGYLLMQVNKNRSVIYRHKVGGTKVRCAWFSDEEFQVDWCFLTVQVPPKQKKYSSTFSSGLCQTF